MRLGLEEHFSVIQKIIYREFAGGFDEIDEDLVEKSFEGRGEHKKRKNKGDKERKSREKQSEALLAMDGVDTSSTNNKKENIIVEEKKESIWYPELPKQLVEATGYKKKEEKEEDFLKRREAVIRSLESKIPNVRSVIEEFGPQVHWAGKILGGSKEMTPWGDPQRGLDFLKNELSIEKKHVESKEKKNKPRGVSGVKEEEKIKDKLSFEDRAKIIEDSDFGGVLFPAYKKYVKGEALPLGLSLDNVLSQVSKLFPTFDAKSFAEEARERLLEKKEVPEPAKKEQEGWTEKLKTDPLLKQLSEIADSEKWKQKIERVSEMNEIDREKEILVLRWLVMKKARGTMDEAVGSVWDRHKVRLVNLGVL